MPIRDPDVRQAKKARRTIAKKVGKSPKTFERYWKSGKEQAGIEEAEKPRNKYAYAMAVALRRAQGTGSKPHKKLSKEAFELRLDEKLAPICEARTERVLIPQGDGVVWLWEFGEYPEWSVNAGQQRRARIAAYDSLEEAQAANPGVPVEGGMAPRDIGQPDVPPAWFDPADAGETW